ncbi:porin family protein [Hymenobacter sp. CRA2]|uniref:porin family protein n=1 Tax=Hymenobacter sp. CRA2 TaxID=1955620 RepID=UPI00098F9176|nr:porin family protein [Hymenobacter sp. CRA2]OON70528.1 hypothetical protein B0919_00420 [Hymenobacter sp. CRA2]
MKKLLLALALGAAANTAMAQDVKFGLKIGPTLSSYYGEARPNNSKYMLGLNGGVSANIGLTDLLSFQPELLYSQKGNEFTNGAVKSTTRLNYLDVPLLLRIDVDGPFFEIGPHVGYALSVTSTDEVNGTSNSFDNKSNVNDWDAGVVLGIGYQLDNGLSIGGRYNPSFTRVAVNDPAGREIKVYNSAIQFQLGYRFGDK